MRANVKSVIVLLTTVLSAACSNPPPSKSDPGAKLVVGAQATPASAAAAAATSPGGGMVVDAKLIQEGYRAVKSKDGVRYCRTAVMTGTRLASTVCLTAEQVAQQKQSAQDTGDTLNRARAVNCKVISCGS